MNNQPKVSIIVPIYNTALYLNKCLDSLIYQEYTNIEIILIDDGSTDDSFYICKKYADMDDRIIFIHQDNKGSVFTRNVGMRIASGDYISFVDSDDFIDKDMIKILIDILGYSRPDVVAFEMEENFPDHTVIKKNKFPVGVYDRNKLEEDIFPYMLSCDDFFNFGILPNLVSKLIKREFLNKCRLEVSDIVTVGDDADVVFQLIAQANMVQFVDICPYHYCKRDDSLMSKEVNVKAIDALRTDLENGFETAKIYNVMGQQLDDYITFIKLLKNPKSVNAVNSIFDDNKGRVALYGAGGFGQAIIAQYSDKVSLWGDKNYKVYLEKGLGVISPEELIKRQNEYDILYIAILNSRLCENIRIELIESGIKKDILYFNKLG